MTSVKYNEKKINFINRPKCAEQKIFCICVDVYKIYDGNDYDEMKKALSELNKKLKINNILIEKYKDMSENPDFEQDHWSRTAERIYEIGHECIRLMKWLIYYDRYFYDKMNYFDILSSLCKYLNELSQR